MLIESSLRQRPVRRLCGELFEMRAFHDLTVGDLLIAQEARESLIGVRRACLHDAADQMFVARFGIDGHVEYGAQRQVALLEQELLTEQLRADLLRLGRLDRIATLYDEGFRGAQQLGLAQVVEQREEAPERDAGEGGEDDQTEREHQVRMSG